MKRLLTSILALVAVAVLIGFATAQQGAKTRRIRRLKSTVHPADCTKA